MRITNSKLIKAVFFFLIILGVSVFVFIKNKNEEQEIYKIKKEISDLSKLPNDEELLKKKDELLRKESSLELYLFDKENPLKFIEMVENLGIQNFLEVNVDKVDVAEGNIVLEVNASGTFDNMMNFISSLEKINKEIMIKNVRFNKILSETGDVTWNIYLNIIGKTK